MSGIAQRLQNLGYLDSNVDFGMSDLGTIREALRKFRASQPAASSASPGNPAPTDPPPSAGNSEPPSSSSGVDSSPTDNAGLDDNGVLDDATTTLLKAAHGL